MSEHEMPMRLSVTWRWKLVGGHVHVRVFSAMVPGDGDDLNYTRGRAGDLTFAIAEWPSITSSLPPTWHLIPEDEPGWLVCGLSDYLQEKAESDLARYEDGLA